MFHKYLLIPTVLSVAGVLMTADMAHAQKGGGGGRGGGGGGGGRGVAAAGVSRGAAVGGVNRGVAVGGVNRGVAAASVYRGGAYHNGTYYHNGAYHNGSYYRPGYGYGIGIGFALGGYGALYPNAYYDPYYLPRVSYYPTPTVIVDPTVAAIPDAPAAPAASSTAASIRVILPDPQAKVFFDGNATKQNGSERIFHTPSLTSSGTYRIRAVYLQNGKEIVQEAVATIRPGETTIVDFTRSTSEEVPVPRK